MFGDIEENWVLYDSDIPTTENSFEPILEDKALTDLAAEIKERDGRIVAFDPMGQGSRMVELGADETLAVGLDFNRDKLKRGIDRSTITELSGDLRDGDTWEEIDRWVLKQGGVSLAISTPGDGVKYFWRTERSDPDKQDVLFSSFVNNVLRQLREGGVFLLESQADLRTMGRYFSNKVFEDSLVPVKVEYNSVLSLAKFVRLQDGEKSVGIDKTF